jgi:hypothetical protein
MNPRSDSNAGPRALVIVDPGFAGVAFARGSAPADTLVIDRHHDNLFQPLPIAFLLWGAVRTFRLIGFGNRVAVFLNWVSAWLTYGAARDRSLARSGGRAACLRSGRRHGRRDVVRRWRNDPRILDRRIIGETDVVDSSFFVSIGAVNPSLTVIANALRVGDHLLERLGRGS